MDLFKLQNLLMDMKNKNITQSFFGKGSSVKFDLTMTFNLRINIASAFDPDRDMKKVQKGEKIYDWENSLKFSITPSEACKLCRNLDKISKGEYVNPEANEKYQNIYTMMHKPDENTTSYFSVKPLEKNGKVQPGSLIISINSTKEGKKSNGSYFIKPDEYVIFKELLKRTYENGPYLKMLINAVASLANSSIYAIGNKDNENGNEEEGENKSSNNNKKSNKKKEENNSDVLDEEEEDDNSDLFEEDDIPF